MEAKERLGRIRILAPASGAIAAAPFLDLTGQISTDGERGLLGFAAAPDFATSGVFYVFVTNPLGDIEIRRYRTLAANRDLADPASGDVILSIGHRQFSNHNGGWIGFGPDGFLWIAVGDGGGSGDPNNRAQDLWSLLGKILRIDVRSDAFPGSAAASTAAITGGPTWKAPCPSRAAPAGRRRRLRNMSTAPRRDLHDPPRFLSAGTGNRRQRRLVLMADRNRSQDMGDQRNQQKGVGSAPPDDPDSAETPYGASAASVTGGIGGTFAAEAAALGLDRPPPAVPGAGPTGGEAIGQGAGRGEVGSGTPRDTGDLGGGGAGTGPAGTGSPGGDGRA